MQQENISERQRGEERKNVKPWWNKDIEEASNNRRIKNRDC